MIELPDDIVPNAATPRLLDFGFVQETVGGGSFRIDRPGNRFEVELSFPPMTGETARIAIARLARAKTEGLRVPYPLQGVSQDALGTPLVDGADSGGIVLKLKGLVPGCLIKEGFWLDHAASDGSRRLHYVCQTVRAGADGKATLTVEPPMRAFPEDGDAVTLGEPVIEGVIVSDLSWQLSPGELASGIQITLREGV